MRLGPEKRTRTHSLPPPAPDNCLVTTRRQPTWPAARLIGVVSEGRPIVRLADWLQVVIGVMGVVATLGVAWMVYRLEKNERTVDKIEEKTASEKRQRTAQQQQELERREARERERRELRRLQHEDDYKAAKETLGVIDSIFEKARRKPLTYDEVKQSKLRESADVLETISKNVKSLENSLMMIVTSCHSIETHSLPNPIDLEYAIRDGKIDANRLFSEIRDLAIFSIAQREAATKGLLLLKEARNAIAREWGS
jgi:hypothetical protein